MKILPTKNIHISNCSIVKRIKDFFLPKKTTMQNIEKDVFEKTASDGVEKMERKQIYPRKLPNCVSGPNEYDHIIPGQGSRVNLYPEDIEKMKSMSIDEQLAYTYKLLREGRYYD